MCQSATLQNEEFRSSKHAETKVMPGATIWLRERPARGGSVASGPRSERMQPGSRCGGHPVTRGGLERGVGKGAAAAAAAGQALLQRLLRLLLLRLLRLLRWSPIATARVTFWLVAGAMISRCA